MTIGAIGANPLLFLNPQSKARGSNAAMMEQLA